MHRKNSADAISLVGTCVLAAVLLLSVMMRITFMRSGSAGKNLLSGNQNSPPTPNMDTTASSSDYSSSCNTANNSYTGQSWAYGLNPGVFDAPNAVANPGQSVTLFVSITNDTSSSISGPQPPIVGQEVCFGVFGETMSAVTNSTGSAQAVFEVPQIATEGLTYWNETIPTGATLHPASQSSGIGVFCVMTCSIGTSSTTTSTTSSSTCAGTIENLVPEAQFQSTNGYGGLELIQSGFVLHVAYNAQNGVELSYANTTFDSSWSGNLSLTFPNGVTAKSSSPQQYNDTYSASAGGFLNGGINLYLPVPQSYVPGTPYFNMSGTYQVSASLKQASSGQQFTANGTFTVSCSSTATTSSSSSSTVVKTSTESSTSTSTSPPVCLANPTSTATESSTQTSSSTESGQ